MKPKDALYLIVLGLLYILILISKILGCDSISRIAIPVMVITIFIYAVISNFSIPKAKIFLLLAFGFVCIGDILINLTTFWKYSVLAFCCTHICLIIYYFLENRFEKQDLINLLIIFIIGLSIFLKINSDITELGLSVLFGVYLSILSTMLWRATCYLKSNNSLIRKLLIMSGSLLFYITDICVSANVIYQSKTLIIITWICYPPALVMLSMMNVTKQSQPSQLR
jgi:hypothetical protein